jgi:large subunit ribosomal protein L12
MEYVYAAMLLHGLGKEITEDNMKQVIAATGAQPDEAQIKAVVSALKGVDIEKVISEAQVSQVASAPAATQTPAQREGKKEEKKEEPKAEEAAAGLSSLFG